MKAFVRLILSLTIVAVSILYLPAQQSKIDSLTSLLESFSQPDTNRVRVLNQLAYEICKSDAAAAKPMALEALDLARSLNDVKGQSECHFTLFYIYTYLGEIDNAKKDAELCRQLSAEIGNTEQEADANYLLGYSFVATGDKEKGKSYYQKCVDISKENNYQEGIGKGSQGLGDIFRTEGDYTQARLNYELNLKISLAENNKNGIRSSYNSLAIVAETLGDYDKALEYYLLALPIAEELGKNNYASILSNMGSLYTAMKNYPKALEYLNLGFEIFKELESKRGIAFSMQDIADVNRKQADLEEGKSRQDKLDVALELYNQALAIRTELGDKRGQSFTHINLCGLYNQKMDYSKALFHAKKSLALREEIGFKKGISRSSQAVGTGYMHLKQYNLALPLLKKSLRMALEMRSAEEIVVANNKLSECYENMGNYKLALKYHKSLKATKDSIFTEDQNKQFAKMQTLYETEKKEKLIAEQDRDIITLETNSAKVERQRNYLIGGVGLAGLLAFLGFRLYRIRKDRNDKKEFAEALLYTQEEERKRIARDLHDSVGQSLLLMKKQLTENHSVTLDNQAMISDALEEVRSISQDLHPFQLEKFGLTATIADAIEKVERSADLFISKEIDNIDEGLSEKAQIHIFRVVQEALSNIVKHAEATAAKLTLQSSNDEIKISIQDNGKGYDHEYALAKSRSLGLRTMYERISAIGGRLVFNNGVQKGSLIEILVPRNI